MRNVYMLQARERGAEGGVDRERGTSVGGGSEQCNKREITTRIARSDIELITCYLYYQDFRFTLTEGRVTSQARGSSGSPNEAP